MEKQKDREKLEITVSKVNRAKNIYQKKSITIDKNAHELLKSIIGAQKKDQDD